MTENELDALLKIVFANQTLRDCPFVCCFMDNLRCEWEDGLLDDVNVVEKLIPLLELLVKERRKREDAELVRTLRLSENRWEIILGEDIPW